MSKLCPRQRRKQVGHFAAKTGDDVLAAQLVVFVQASDRFFAAIDPDRAGLGIHDPYQWHFNLDTKGTGMSTGIWLLRATLSDGSDHSVWIQLK